MYLFNIYIYLILIFFLIINLIIPTLYIYIYSIYFYFFSCLFQISNSYQKLVHELSSWFVMSTIGGRT